MLAMLASAIFSARGKTKSDLPGYGFVIKGAWDEAMRQIGNAVPVLLGETIGRELASRLGARKDTSDARQPCRARL